MSDLIPANALDSNVVLATSVHAQPGVYALLLGSGVSTGAGILTGWGIIKDLVRRAATAEAPEDSDAADRALQDPEAWWLIHGNGKPLGYSNLIGEIDKTPAGRRNQIARYFEPDEAELEAGLKTPSAAHRAVAGLVKRGSVRVILTTNFDRLVERALEDVGISPQVIRTPSDVHAMNPLSHAPVTVVKLHGDYADLFMRNTVDELGEYPEEWNQLLDRVFDEYGLLVSGWSAEWDTALVEALRRSRSRRYPVFWDSRSSKGDSAKDLLAWLGGTVVLAADADTLFTDFGRRLEALDRLAEPPITTAIAVQRLKRDLLDPVRRIDVYDLVMGEVSRVADYVASLPVNVPGLTQTAYVERASAIVAKATPLLRLITTGVQHDRGGLHNDLWLQVMQRLTRLDQIPDGTPTQGMLQKQRLLPGVLALRAAGATAIAMKRDDLFLRLCTEPGKPSPYKPGEWMSAGYLLSDYDALDSDCINGAADGNGWVYPPSHFLKEAMREVMSDALTTKEEYEAAHHAFEFKRALYESLAGTSWVTPGEFLISFDLFVRADFGPVKAFQSAAASASADWPWWRLLGSREQLDEQLGQFVDRLEQIRRWR